MPDRRPAEASLRLSDLGKGRVARVVSLDETGAALHLAPGQLERRLIEMGVLEGAEVEIQNHGFPNQDPLAVRVDGHVLALRRAEARAVRVVPLR